MLPQRSCFDEIADAVPEIAYLQPKGIYSVLLQSGTSKLKLEFGAALLGVGGFPASPVDQFCGEPAKKIKTVLQVRPPIFLEDNPTGLGECGIRDKRGALGRCTRCGLLMHYTCIAPNASGEAQKCPRCTTEDSELPKEP